MGVEICPGSNFTLFSVRSATLLLYPYAVDLATVELVFQARGLQAA